MFSDGGRAIIDLSTIREGRGLPGASAGALEWQNLALKERLTELEIELENNWWIRLVDRADRDFSRPALRQISRMARLTYLKNPLINRAVEVQAHYVHGQGMSVRARDERLNAVVQAFMDDRGNRAALTSQESRLALDRQLSIDGNLFVVLFPNPETGQVKARTIPFDQIEAIITNPEDKQEPRFYKRQWTQQTLDEQTGEFKPETRVAYYPDIDYQPDQRPKTIGEAPVLWGSPVLHRKVGGTLDMSWGVPEFYAAIDWALAYKSMLENDATRSAALARFAWQLKQQNSTATTRAAAKSQLATTLGSGDNGMAIETNPPPVTGSTFISGAGTDLKPVSIAGAMPDPDHARPHRLMVAAGTGLPETFFGDSDVGNHATAKTLDRPTELKMLNRRALWIDFWQELFAHVIDWALAAPQSPLPADVRRAARSPLGDAASIAANPEALDRHVEVSFPDLLEHDVSARVQAIVAAATLSGFQAAGTMPPETVSELLLSALGLDDIDEIMRDLAGDAGEGVAQESLVEAVRGLRRAVEGFRGTPTP